MRLRVVEVRSSSEATRTRRKTEWTIGIGLADSRNIHSCETETVEGSKTQEVFRVYCVQRSLFEFYKIWDRGGWVKIRVQLVLRNERDKTSLSTMIDDDERR